MAKPPCPVTGEPAVRHIQTIKSRFIADLWRYEFGIDVRGNLAPHSSLDLWESPTGLHFFDPMIEGNDAFYTNLYACFERRSLCGRDCIRHEFEMAMRSIDAGNRVLDVGCGNAQFRRHIPHAQYTGVDPLFGAPAGIDDVYDQTLAEHLILHAGSYDVVCAFQVLEHVKAPSELFVEMIHAARPGGLLIVGVPHVPSAFTRIPNFVLNAPPHHLTWWTKEALAELARRNGATVETIESVPWGFCDSLFFWIERCSPLRCREVFYRNRLSWHAAAVFGFLAGRLVHGVVGAPRQVSDEGGGLLMQARRH